MCWKVQSGLTARRASGPNPRIASAPCAEIVNVDHSGCSQGNLHVIVARWMAAARDAAGLPLEGAGFIVAEVRPEKATRRDAVRQKPRGRAKCWMLVVVSGRENDKLGCHGVDEARAASVVRTVMGCNEHVCLQRHRSCRVVRNHDLRGVLTSLIEIGETATDGITREQDRASSVIESQRSIGHIRDLDWVKRKLKLVHSEANMDSALP
jgi:hypothetical protein